MGVKKEIRLSYEEIPRSGWDEQLSLLEQEAYEAARKAYAPYSRFKVGAAVLLSNGIVVTGSNQENAAYPSGSCAERTALFYAGAQYPKASVVMIVIVAENEQGRIQNISPCGACRQVMAEVSSRQKAAFAVALCGTDKATVIKNNWDLLPFSFSAHSLSDPSTQE